MKSFLSKLLLLIIASTHINTLVASALSPSKVVRLEIIAPTSARVNEAIDITIRAVDENKKTVTGYRGSVMFYTDTVGDIVPAIGKTITFSADDNGEKKFSKGVIFKKTGKQKLYINDVTDDIIGDATVMVDPASTTPVVSTDTITIVTPISDSKITGDTLTVGGKSRKNSKVAIILNGKEVGNTVVDESGLFSYTLTGINQESNILSAKLLDAGSTSIVSPDIKFTKILNSATTYGISISPALTVEVSSPIVITVDATPSLANLSISLDGSALPAKEATAGKYVIETVAPLQMGSYPISISQKDSLGQSKTTTTTTVLNTTEKLQSPTPNPVFKNIKTTTLDSRITFDFSIEHAPADLKSFKIAYGKNADSLSQEVVTLSLDKIASKTQSGAYVWYIDKIPADTYTFKIFARNAEGSIISGLVSEPIVATIGKTTCTIGNISTLMVDTDEKKSVLSWESLTGAIAYRIYRVSPAGDYTLFQETKTPSHTIHLASGDIIYENFAVKAICDPQTESKEYSETTKVQTGPELMAFVIIASSILGIFVLRRRFSV